MSVKGWYQPNSIVFPLSIKLGLPLESVCSIVAASFLSHLLWTISGLWMFQINIMLTEFAKPNSSQAATSTCLLYWGGGCAEISGLLLGRCTEAVMSTRRASIAVRTIYKDWEPRGRLGSNPSTSVAISGKEYSLLKRLNLSKLPCTVQTGE